MKFPGAEYLLVAAFFAFVAAVAGGGLLAALTTRVIRSVCGLAICCFGLAGLYYFLRSPFLALMEILIYVGAVCITIVFAIMLAEPEETPSQETRKEAFGWGAAALAIAAGIFWGVNQLGVGLESIIPAERVNDGSVKVIGKSLLTTYSLAFELISVAILVAILGSLVVARTGRDQA
jgi:NADH-quinone oxidoreductase subunit J